MIKNYFLNYRTLQNDFTLKLGHKEEINFHGAAAEENWSVTLSDTGEDSMTGARVKRIEKFIHGDTFLLTYGDGVGDVNLGEVLEFHKRHGKFATVTGVRPPGRFGEMVTANGVVTEFNEKPQSSGGWINGGFFVLSRKFFEYLNDDPNLILEQEPLRKLAADKELVCFPHHGFWQPMDTFREFELLNQLWKNNAAPWKVW